MATMTATTIMVAAAEVAESNRDIAAKSCWGGLGSGNCYQDCNHGDDGGSGYGSCGGTVVGRGSGSGGGSGIGGGSRVGGTVMAATTTATTATTAAAAPVMVTSTAMTQTMMKTMAMTRMTWQWRQSGQRGQQRQLW
jgi:hypothetical protein